MGDYFVIASEAWQSGGVVNYHKGIHSTDFHRGQYDKITLTLRKGQLVGIPHTKRKEIVTVFPNRSHPFSSPLR